MSVAAQDYPNLEHIVVDGGSTDGTVPFLEGAARNYGHLRWVSEPDQGQADALNKGFRALAGDFVSWLNSDDLLVDRRALSRVAQRFHEDPHADVLYGNRIVIGADSELLKLQYTNSFEYRSVVDGFLPVFQENVFFRREVVKANSLNAELHVVLDTDYWLRLGREYKWAFVNDIFAAFRIHQTNKTVQACLKARWNQEKDFLTTKYGATRFKVGQGFQLNRALHRFRALSRGAYNNYYRLVPDVLQLCGRTDLAFDLKISRWRIVLYALRSLRPYSG